MTSPCNGVTAAVLVLAAGLSLAPTAAARDGGDDRVEVEKRATCERGTSGKFRVRARDGELRVRFELHDRASGRKWKVVLVHERRVVARVTAKTQGDDHRIEVERTLTDLDGADDVSVRASGPGGHTCTAKVTVAGSV